MIKFYPNLNSYYSTRNFWMY